eukprot:1380946-Amorphochlora_amoeboformis.AAC.1
MRDFEKFSKSSRDNTRDCSRIRESAESSKKVRENFRELERFERFFESLVYFFDFLKLLII